MAVRVISRAGGAKCGQIYPPWPLQLPAYDVCMRWGDNVVTCGHVVNGIGVGLLCFLVFSCRLKFLGCLVIYGGAWLNAFSRMAAPRVPFRCHQSFPLGGKRLAPSGDAEGYLSLISVIKNAV